MGKAIVLSSCLCSPDMKHWLESGSVNSISLFQTVAQAMPVLLQRAADAKVAFTCIDNQCAQLIDQWVLVEKHAEELHSIQ